MLTTLKKLLLLCKQDHERWLIEDLLKIIQGISEDNFIKAIMAIEPFKTTISSLKPKTPSRIIKN